MSTLKTLPKYQAISVGDIPKASTLLVYGGKGLIQWFGSKVYKFKYKPIPYHAAFYAEYGRVVNVGFTTTLRKIQSFCLSKRRVDVIIYKLNKEKRMKAIDFAYTKAAGKGYKWRFYDFKGFAYFGVRAISDKLKFIKKPLKWLLKPSKRDDFCSDMVAETFEQAGLKVSPYSDELTAPWDLLQWAMEHPEIADIRTLHVGDKFKT